MAGRSGCSRVMEGQLCAGSTASRLCRSAFRRHRGGPPARLQRAVSYNATLPVKRDPKIPGAKERVQGRPPYLTFQWSAAASSSVDGHNVDRGFDPSVRRMRLMYRCPDAAGCTDSSSDGRHWQKPPLAAAAAAAAASASTAAVGAAAGGVVMVPAAAGEKWSVSTHRACGS